MSLLIKMMRIFLKVLCVSWSRCSIVYFCYHWDGIRRFSITWHAACLRVRRRYIVWQARPAVGDWHRKTAIKQYCCLYNSASYAVLGCLYDPANVQQTSSSIITYGSKRPANFQQTSSKRPALHLLEVCWTFAGSCKHPISVMSSSAVGDVAVTEACLIALARRRKRKRRQRGRTDSVMTWGCMMVHDQHKRRQSATRLTGIRM